MPVIDSPVEVEEVKEAEVMVEEKPAEVVAAVPEIELEVHPATCDACNTTIKGTRHKCTLLSPSSWTRARASLTRHPPLPNRPRVPRL